MIGVFDSGIGGLTVLKALLEDVPGVPMVYLGDTARTPYGSKSPDTIKDYSLQNASFLVEKGARVLVIACNTASSHASRILAEQFHLPVFEVISPGAERALEVSRKMRIGVIGTRATVESGIYERKIKAINKQARVFSAACPLLVPLIEEGWIEKPETNRIVKNYLRPLKIRQIDTLVLGCTHYPVLQKTIQRKIGKRVKIVDSARAVAARVKTFIERNPGLRQLPDQAGTCERCTIYITDQASQFQKTARLIMKVKLQIRQADIRTGSACCRR